MVSFIDSHRAQNGVESICAQLRRPIDVLQDEGAGSRLGEGAAEVKRDGEAVPIRASTTRTSRPTALAVSRR